MKVSALLDHKSWTRSRLISVETNVLVPYAIIVSALVVTQTPRPTSIEVYSTSSSSSALQGDRRDAIRIFLADRVRDAYGIEAGETPVIDREPRAYAIGLHWEQEARVLVEVAREGELLASRPIDVADISAACAGVWMLVSSAIDRDLAAINSVETATISAEIIPEEKSLGPTLQPIAVKSSAAPAKLFALEDIESISGTLYTESSLHGGFSFGPAAVASMELKQGIILSASFAYRSSSPVDGLELRRVPFALRVGAEPSRDYDLEAGVSVGLDIGGARVGSQTSAIFGLGVGPYFRGRIPFAQWDGAEISAAAELGVNVALVRGEYALAGAIHDEGIFSARLLAGVEWRWR
jgi:hypothetical protein